MKKRAFTLAELLITLCIIGLLAGILTPQLAKLRPNKDKLMVIKYYNAISETIEYLLSNPGIYVDGSDSSGDCVGLACTNKPSLDEYSSYHGQSKLKKLLAKELDINGKTNNPFTIAPNVTCNVSNGSSTYTIKLKFGTDTTCEYPSCSKKINQYSYKIDEYGRLVETESNKLLRAYLQNPTKLNTLQEDLELANEIKD